MYASIAFCAIITDDNVIKIDIIVIFFIVEIIYFYLDPLPPTLCPPELLDGAPEFIQPPPPELPGEKLCLDGEELLGE